MYQSLTGGNEHKSFRRKLVPEDHNEENSANDKVPSRMTSMSFAKASLVVKGLHTNPFFILIQKKDSLIFILL